MKKILILIALLSPLWLIAQDNLGYQRPPADIAAMIEAPGTPGVSFDSKAEWMLLLERPGYAGIEVVSQEELRLAGLRINPAINGPSRSASFNGLKLKKVNGGEEFAIKGLPENPKIASLAWSPNEKMIAFTHTSESGIELWVIDVAGQSARKLTEGILNQAGYGSPYSWLSDNETILVKTIVQSRGTVPAASRVPTGPVIQENIGGKAPSRTYQDLLKNPYDEQLFEYYLNAQLALVSVKGGMQEIGEPRVVRSMSTSPDGNFVMVESIQKPYSYLVPASLFPYHVEVLDMSGKLVKRLAEVPLAEKLPIGFNSVITGPRSHNWRPDVPATVYWAEAQDGGDPNKEAAIRDVVFMQSAPFTAAPVKLAQTQYRYSGTYWADQSLAIVTEGWWKTRKDVRSVVNPGQPGKSTVLIDRSSEDLYNDPGTPVFVKNAFGRNVMLVDKKSQDLIMTAEGYSPEGNRPFVSRFNLKTKKQSILWRSEAPYYESPVEVVNVMQGKIITSRESQEMQPNYFLRDIKKGTLTQLTDFPHPSPQLLGVNKEMLTYFRKDGVKLTATLYTPKGYDKEKDGPLPVFMWAYPREYKSADAAAQVRTSPYRFTRVNWGSPIFWVTQGYAIMDQTEMPIVGEGEKEPNDSYIEQLVANAEAAINKIVEMGIGDAKRIAVGGHSYGAFMTANLLSHSNLFAAGIARSGAYNRTLTPFGFQAEERTYWQAPETYFNMSPFSFADKMKTPLLMIHGEADNNSGTFPIQSERYYNAIKGHGATTRLVFLPHESHGYAAKESILHTLWEMDQWLEKYVKNIK